MEAAVVAVAAQALQTHRIDAPCGVAVRGHLRGSLVRVAVEVIAEPDAVATGYARAAPPLPCLCLGGVRRGGEGSAELAAAGDSPGAPEHVHYARDARAALEVVYYLCNHA